MEESSLTALARRQLTLAREASSGRSAHTVFGGHEHTLRQTVIALAAGRRLDEHDSPGEAIVHVLHGRVRLVAGTPAGRVHPETSSSCPPPGTPRSSRGLRGATHRVDTRRPAGPHDDNRAPTTAAVQRNLTAAGPVGPGPGGPEDPYAVGATGAPSGPWPYPSETSPLPSPC
jgi:hypothetical protein